MNKLVFYLMTFSLVISLSACGETQTADNKTSANKTTAVTNANTKPVANNPLAVATPTPSQITNNAPTIAPIYKAYCAAVVNKDEAAIRKYYTADTLKYFEGVMKEDGLKSFVKLLEEDQISNEVCEASNERISGDKAVATIKTRAYPTGYDVLFVKENGEWKMSNLDPSKANQ